MKIPKKRSKIVPIRMSEEEEKLMRKLMIIEGESSIAGYLRKKGLENASLHIKLLRDIIIRLDSLEKALCDLKIENNLLSGSDMMKHQKIQIL